MFSSSSFLLFLVFFSSFFSSSFFPGGQWGGEEAVGRTSITAQKLGKGGGEWGGGCRKTIEVIPLKAKVSLQKHQLLVTVNNMKSNQNKSIKQKMNPP